MRRISLIGACILTLTFLGCTGGAAGSPSDDIGDLYVLTHSPGNGDELDIEDSLDGFNHLNNPTLRVPESVVVQFTNSVLRESVINDDPTDPQGTINVRLFYFDTNQGAFDPTKPKVVGVNPPGGNVIVPASSALTTLNPDHPNDAIVITPSGIGPTNPLREGQYSVIVELGVKGADGQNMRGREYFFYFRVGRDTLPPVIVDTKPTPNEQNVDPTSEIRITMSETIRASSVNASTIEVAYQPAGQAKILIPGFWYTDGGNQPGNNFPQFQLDINGNPGFSGISPRNGVDLVFRPDMGAFPTNMRAEDPNDPFCSLISDPPQKGNQGLPLGATVTVTFKTTGVGVVDTAGIGVPAGSPLTTFSFEVKRAPDAIFAPGTPGAVFYGDPQGVGVIEVNPSRTPYLIGPNPPRPNNSVVTTVGASAKVVRVPVQDLVGMVTDTRTYSAFYTFICILNSPTIFHTTVYALSRSTGGGEVTVIDSFSMTPLGKFGTPSPGGVAVTANGVTAGSARAAVSNFSANTVTIFDIADVRFYTGTTLFATQGGLAGAVQAKSAKLVLNEDNFRTIFKNQKADTSSPPGPQVIGTINVGISPSAVDITGLPNSLGVYSPPFCFSPILNTNTIVGVLNAGENTVDFSELTNLSQSAAISPDLRGVTISSQPVDIEWAQAWSFTTGSYYALITGIGGTAELFASGFIANRPSVRPESSSNLSPNKIINNIGGFQQPTAIQWTTSGNAVTLQPGATPYAGAFLIAETGQNRLVQVAITQQSPSNLFETINQNHPAGLGPVDITGDPQDAQFTPCTPLWTTYYVANAGEGTVRTSDYGGGVVGQTIAVPGVQRVASWWSR